MSDVLERICAKKLGLIMEQRVKCPEPTLENQIENQEAPRKFVQALKTSLTLAPFSLIAEIKKASPSKGLIREQFNPVALANAYKNGGATCLSVLTDTPFFQGKNSHLIDVHSTVDLPILRKDFILDPYQILEARAIGADCVLLIMAALTDKLAALLYRNAKELNMDVLLEVHDENELDRALALEPDILGINNRNLKTLQVDLSTTERLASKVPNEVLMVSESGIYNNTDLKRISAVGINCFLVGESLMRKSDVEQAVKKLLGDDINHNN